MISEPSSPCVSIFSPKYTFYFYNYCPIMFQDNSHTPQSSWFRIPVVSIYFFLNCIKIFFWLILMRKVCFDILSWKSIIQTSLVATSGELAVYSKMLVPILKYQRYFKMYVYDLLVFKILAALSSHFVWKKRAIILVSQAEPRSHLWLHPLVGFTHTTYIF